MRSNLINRMTIFFLFLILPRMSYGESNSFLECSPNSVHKIKPALSPLKIKEWDGLCQFAPQLDWSGCSASSLQRLKSRDSDLADGPSTVKIIEHQSPNAYLVDNSTIIITRGLLDNINNGSELSFVIGHELGHFLINRTKHSDAHCSHIVKALQGGFLAEEIAADSHSVALSHQLYDIAPISVDLISHFNKFNEQNCSLLGEFLKKRRDNLSIQMAEFSGLTPRKP